MPVARAKPREDISRRRCQAERRRMNLHEFRAWVGSSPRSEFVECWFDRAMDFLDEPGSRGQLVLALAMVRDRLAAISPANPGGRLDAALRYKGCGRWKSAAAASEFMSARWRAYREGRGPCPAGRRPAAPPQGAAG